MDQWVLITGGIGWLGSHLARTLVQRGDRVVFYDNVSASPTQTLLPFRNKVKFVQGNILDLSQGIYEEKRISTIRLE